MPVAEKWLLRPRCVGLRVVVVVLAPAAPHDKYGIVFQAKTLLPGCLAAAAARQLRKTITNKKEGSTRPANAAD